MKGKLMISRVMTNTDNLDFISIGLADDGYKMLFQIKVAADDFASAITGVGAIPCDYKVWDRTEV